MCDDLLARVEPPLRSVLEQASKYYCDCSSWALWKMLITFFFPVLQIFIV